MGYSPCGCIASDTTYLAGKPPPTISWLHLAQSVKNPPAVQERQERWVQSLSGEVPLEKEMTTHSSILTWRTPWTEEPGGLQLWDHKELTQLSNFIHTDHCFKGQWKGKKMPKQRVI